MMSVSTHLMFQRGKAQAAIDLYASIFPGFTVVSVEHYGPNEDAAGLLKTAHINFNGHSLLIIDSPITHDFDFTPAVSLFVDFDDVAELDRAFERLADGGDIKMPLDDYGFSIKFGWLTDCFGVSWQLNLPSA